MLRLAAVAVFLGGQFGTLAHKALVQHRVCPEHGELEDVGHGHGPSALALPHAADQTAFTAGGESSDEHHHCAVASATREFNYQLSEANVVALAPTRAVAHSYGLDFEITPRVIYGLAPKQSPPA